uniref:Uncharacterized protein n=1 Tax=Lepeophtheirus salmonis TaxID=72036 RepID=A0A0K2SXM0_LEPSM
MCQTMSNCHPKYLVAPIYIFFFLWLERIILEYNTF